MGKTHKKPIIEILDVLFIIILILLYIQNAELREEYEGAICIKPGQGLGNYTEIYNDIMKNSEEQEWEYEKESRYWTE